MVKKKIEELKPGLIIIDPKSKFFGLPEDCNTSTAIWMNHIQELIVNMNATILLPHHVSKARENYLEASSARGASAFIDACRWAANVRVMDEETGRKLEVDNHRAYIEVLVTKSNYTAPAVEPLRFRHVEDGLEQVELGQKRLEGIANLIRGALKKSGYKMVSKNEILKTPEGEFVRNYIKKHDRKASRTDIDNAIIHGLKIGMFYELEVRTGARPRTIICPQKD